MRCARCRSRRAKVVCGQCEVRPYCSQECANDDRWVHVERSPHCPEGSHVADLVLAPGIYVGGIEALSDPDIMSHVSAVVSCIVPEDDDERTLVLRKVGPDRAHMWVSVWDHPDEPIERYWEEAARFIATATASRKGGGGDVLVHCHAGMSRSVSTVIYYMITRRRSEFPTVDAALAHIRKARCIANPNRGFMAKLRRILE